MRWLRRMRMPVLVLMLMWVGLVPGVSLVHFPLVSLILRILLLRHNHFTILLCLHARLLRLSFLLVMLYLLYFLFTIFTSMSMLMSMYNVYPSHFFSSIPFLTSFFEPSPPLYYTNDTFSPIERIITVNNIICPFASSCL